MSGASKATVSERKKAEAGLRESRSRYLALLETTNDFIWEMDARGRYTYCSPQMEKLWGLKPEEMIGKTPFDLIPEEHRAAAAAEFAGLARSPRPFSGLESAAVVAGGRLIFIETNGVPFFDAKGRLLGFRGISRDITQRKQTEATMAKARERAEIDRKRLEDILEAVPQAIVLVDAPTRKIAYLNKTALGLYGVDYTRYDMASHLDKVRALRTDGSPFPFEEMPLGRSLGTGESVHGVEMVIEGADGRRVPVSVSSAPLFDTGGKVQTVIVAFDDITVRKNAEEQLALTNRRIKDILASIQDDFYVLDRDWRFVFASRHFTSRIGKDPKDFVGNRIWEMFPRHLGTVYEENLRAAMDNREVRRFEIKGQYTDATYRITVFPSPEGVTVLGIDITEQKRNEDAARESQERLRFALETSQTGAWELDLVDHTAFRSLDHDRIFGYNKLLPEWTYEMFLNHVIPEDRPDVDAKFQRATATKGMWNFECRIRRADGEIRWIWAAGRHRLDATGEARRMVGIVQDISERKQAEALRQALAEQERLRLGVAVEQAPDAIVMLDPDGTIRYSNAAFGFTNRISRDEVRGRSYFDEFATKPSSATIKKAIASGATWQGHMSRPAADGRTVELDVVASAVLDPAGAVVGGLVTEKDVTFETTLQRQLRQSQKMEALGTLAGGIAHDFNNILNPIFISMELALLEPSLDLAVRRHLEVGLKAAERGRDLVKQVIAFSRQKEKERKRAKVGPIIREAVKFLRVSLPSTIQIEADIHDEAGYVIGDPAHVHQIVMNLSSNAAYAMRQNGGVLSVGLTGIEVPEDLAGRVPGLKTGPYVRLTVADTGTGMTPDVRERLFDPFFTTKGPGEGSGMGLPVVDGILRDYGGAIAVETAEGLGSTFTVYLPRIEHQEPEAESAPEVVPKGSGRVLLVDDEQVQVYSIQSMLEKLGYDVTALTDGREALNRFRIDPGSFDLVITDQTMPYLTGMQLAGEILKLRADIPIILCTGFSEVVDAKKAHTAGIREFLMKPYSVREMAEVIRRVRASAPKS